MNTKSVVACLVRTCVVAGALMLSAPAGSLLAAPIQPEIISVHSAGINIVITVEVPAGLRRISLDGRSHFTSGAWEPRAVHRLDGTGGIITFTLPRSSDLQVMRVRANEQDRLPENFYRGPTSFAGRSTVEQSASENSPMVKTLAPLVTTAAEPRILSASAATASEFANQSDLADAGGATSLPRPVEESDIWKLRGNTLYYFNQYRGLQVIDLSNADAPSIRGVFSLPGVGEGMYLLGANHVVLLARMECHGPQSDSEMLVLDVSGASPKVAATLPVRGQITASRLVGSALYVASEVWRSSTNSNGFVQWWERSTHIGSFDLTDPTQPLARSVLDYSSSENVITATDEFLFVAARAADGNGYTTDVHCLDISAPNGVIRPRGSVRVNGQVADKFKIHFHGDVLSVVSWGVTTNSAQVTKLQTFSLAQPDSPTQLGELHFALNEQLFATRFDGPRLYAVTYRRIDPLWVIDLSNPVQPRISGELQVPGWSTYIEPWGDRLVTVGIDDVNGNRVAARLFDVSNPSQPALLSKISLGENSSWSEATQNEKAVAILPEAGLILLPYEGWATNGNAKRVQLIDLKTNALTARGVIEHEFAPRRATVHGDRVYSISPRELLCVDATNRDQPQVRSALELSWPVDRVFVHGDYLLELSKSDAVVRVTSASEPDEVLAAYQFTNSSPVIGATVRDGRLYILQRQGYDSGPPLIMIPFQLQAVTFSYQSEIRTPSFQLSIFDLSALPALSILGSTEATNASSSWGADFEALWPKPGLLVWSGGASYQWNFNPRPVRFVPERTVFDAAVPMPVVTFANNTATFSPFSAQSLTLVSRFEPTYTTRLWRGSGEHRLIAFDVRNAATPQFVSALNLATNGGWNFSSAHAADGLIFQSHQFDDRIVTGTNYHVSTYSRLITDTNLVAITNVTPAYSYTTITNNGLRTNVSSTVRSAWPAGTRFAAGFYHSLALLPDGSVSGWGDNSFGQLGDGTFISRSQAQTLPTLSGIAAVTAGGFHSLALQSNGTAIVWGHALYGQLGYAPSNAPSPSGPPPLPTTAIAEPTPLAGLPSLRVLAGGDYHTLALTTGGALWSWGANWYGQLGDDTPSKRFTPTSVAALTNLIAVAAGSRHSLGIRDNGSVLGWGRNDFGQLGNGNRFDQHSPVRAGGLDGVIAVAGGLRHSLALKADGSVWSWGGDQWESVTPPPNVSPRQVMSLSNITAIAAGRFHNLALDARGAVWTWGRNDQRQLGLAGATFSSQPRPVAGLDGVVAIAAGAYHSIAVRNDGTAFAWGDNEFGQLGEGDVLTTTNVFPFTEITRVTSIVYTTNVIWHTNIQYRTETVRVTNAYERVTWIERHYVDVVDYADPLHPTVRQPVNIPGHLKGISHDGAMLYTVGTRDETNNVGAVWLDASAYDEVSVSLVDSLRLPASETSPLVVSGANIYLSRPGATNEASQIESWTISETTGRFTPTTSARLPLPAQSLFGLGNALAVQAGRDLHLFDSGLNRLGSETLVPCVQADLDHAAYGTGRGLWVPLGEYGLKHVAIGNQ